LTTGENGRLQNKVQQTIELLDDLQMAVWDRIRYEKKPVLTVATEKPLFL
jgi:hypothetical protein